MLNWMNGHKVLIGATLGAAIGLVLKTVFGKEALDTTADEVVSDEEVVQEVAAE